MGNGLAKQLTQCFSGDVRRHVAAAVTSEPYDEGLGHSFCYLRPDLPSSEKTTTFRSISGASVSANASTPLSTSLIADLNAAADTSAAAFESSVSFAAVPLQPIPRFPSGPLSGPLAADRGFLSGPIERGFMSGPLDNRSAALFSGPLDRLPSARRRLRRRVGGSGAASLLRGLSKAISRTLSIAHASKKGPETGDIGGGCGDEFSSSDAADSMDPNLQWAQGKAGEDRVHVVISEDYGWVFVGIYDGFNGPDATDHLLSNLYPAVHRELKGLLWDEEDDTETPVTAEFGPGSRPNNRKQTRWKYEFDSGEKRPVLDQRLEEQLSGNHVGVLKALSLALRRTEESYLDSADETLSENPELALMGSCVLAMLMKGEDVYLMNVGDSRAVLARNKEPELWSLARKAKHDLHRINEDVPDEFSGDDQSDRLPGLAAVQLTMDHSTCVEEEVQRIRTEHREDASAIANDRVKGSLKVTRAFGAGFLKQPKWNNALLEVFRIDYVGTSPYITCTPSLYHHKLGPKDRFLILSSDGLYQYFTNEEAVAEVELFISSTPEGDPAQHLVEEVIFRAANKAGMEFHELLEIPQGDRRRYHDDVSIIVISFEGRIWKSCF